MSNQPLFIPYRMGDLDLPNRIVMAPLTRMRAQPHDHVPTALQAKYYARRTSAGLIIAEATAISPEGFGWADTPGLWTEKQVRGWRRVTDAVHAAGGRIIAQLWHTGAISHPELLNGAQPVSASNVDPDQISVTRTGRKPTVTPRPLTKQEIQVTVVDFARAARNAMPKASAVLNHAGAKKLAGKVAVITGGSTGMGLATARRFLLEGADHVFITGRRKDALESAVAEIGEKVTGVAGDVASMRSLNS